MHDKLRSLTTVIALTAGLSMSAALHAQAIATPPATTVVVVPAPAAEVKPPPDPYTITGNFGIYSQYIFRGLRQTDGKPAFQGGFDYAHTNGWYMGTWGSNISWIHDLGTVCDHGCSLEWDFYGGWKYAINDDWGTDLGVLYYFYPGSYIDGAINPSTTEVYAAISWKWLSFKFSDTLGNTFGVANAKGTYYADLSANFPLNDIFTLNAHVGSQQYHGSNNGVSNSDALSYTDWKLGITWVYNGYNIGAYYTDSNSKDEGYTIAGRNIGKSTGVLFVQKTF